MTLTVGGERLTGVAGKAGAAVPWMTVGKIGLSNILLFLDQHPSVIPLASALATAVAAFAAWRSARASERSLKEAERARIQVIEPFLSISFPNPYFTMAWRPETLEAPMVVGGWGGWVYGAVGLEQVAMLISNFGGGPALDLRISVEALASDVDVPDARFPAQASGGGERGIEWSDGVLKGSVSAGTSARQSRVIKVQNDFASSCARDAPVFFYPADDLLLRLLPTTLKLEQAGYFPRGTPATEGRIGWTVRIRYRTVLGEEHETCKQIYAERVRIDVLPNGRGERWMEKFYRCELKVTPSDGFESTPNSVEVHASYALPTVTIGAPAFTAPGGAGPGTPKGGDDHFVPLGGT